jgi:hypothetical protein
LWEEPDLTVQLADFDVIVVFTSAGKDSAAMAAEVIRRAPKACSTGWSPYADLGVMQWPGTRELAEQQARRLGIGRFEVVRRYRNGQVEDLLGYALRWGYWPTPDAQ